MGMWHAYNTSTWEAEAGGKSLKSAWATHQDAVTILVAHT
jgi:hypothetical protein